ncbi:hypothetical protein F4808DRAFT_434558 [Astrocystis sublimbata]|nr:hypothetical protein F4808DRAFT_434558 [Astrocystis sublimbata]
MQPSNISLRGFLAIAVFASFTSAMVVLWGEQLQTNNTKHWVVWHRGIQFSPEDRAICDHVKILREKTEQVCDRPFMLGDTWYSLTGCDTNKGKPRWINDLDRRMVGKCRTYSHYYTIRCSHLRPKYSRHDAVAHGRCQIYQTDTDAR